MRREKTELLRSIANILLLSLDGQNIGNAVGRHASAGDREYFKRASAGDRLVMGLPIHSRSGLGWVIPIARPVSSDTGAIRGVLVVAVFVDSFRDLISANELHGNRMWRPMTASGPRRRSRQRANSVAIESQADTKPTRRHDSYFGLNTLPSSQAIMRYMICLLFFSSIIV
jgi:hypothetical protein